MRIIPAVAAVACLTFAQPVLAQGPQNATPEQQHDKDTAETIAKHWAVAPTEETETSYTSSANVDGHSIGYKATAGTLTIRDDQGKPVASIFYTAYTTPGAHRPVTFFYNGGPGSATLWLRMGSFAPDAVLTTDPVAVAPAPYHIGPNPDTLIGTTDMVFIDAVGTGYSRILGDAKPKDFYGVDQDATAFTKAIKRYLTKNKRWSDPKYIFGESYGTTRSAALALQLENAGVELNGVVLLSSVLNYGASQPGYDTEYIGYLPTFAAVAWYHNKIADKPADLATFVAQARAFAAGPYASALAKGTDITRQETDQIARQMAHFTGLPVDYIKDANLRVSASRFRKELLRDQRETLGRFDGRYMGTDVDAAGERPGYDPSDTGISGAYVSGFMDRLTRKFDYKTNLDYRLSVWDTRPWDWDFSHQGPDGRPQAVVDVAEDLARAMRTNPHLHVLSLNGYYDMATPFFKTEYDLKHMMLPENLRSNLQFHYYPAGHMVYLNPVGRHEMRLDLQRFYAASGS
ncbi:peptidase S10 [Porphyrobacter algicida]|uniref:Peptidase S10 n=1 Tax=Qipengyuania algicida TaxID=1836209 RepID=A0A845ALX5_9SPHN|nr:peptidase S10 [Qipengyuania algicida]MXP29891.1 peptidase S10 [Qipengyuania algicida]